MQTLENILFSMWFDMKVRRDCRQSGGFVQTERRYREGVGWYEDVYHAVAPDGTTITVGSTSGGVDRVDGTASVWLEPALWVILPGGTEWVDDTRLARWVEEYARFFPKKVAEAAC